MENSAKDKKSDLPFSYRMNKKKAKTPQIESIDDELRNRIWNALYAVYFDTSPYPHYDTPQPRVFRIIFDGFFRLRIDELGNTQNILYTIKKKFFALQWNEVYDFVEFMLKKSSTNYVRTFAKSSFSTDRTR